MLRTPQEESTEAWEVGYSLSSGAWATLICECVCVCWHVRTALFAPGQGRLADIVKAISASENLK
eukprot:10333711-Prorocentrum_lima.AAC.1